MRKLVALAVVMFGGVALAGSVSSGQPPSGPPPRGGGWREGGRIDHSRQPDHAGLPPHVGSGPRTWGAWDGYSSGWPGIYGSGYYPYGGARVFHYRTPFSPYSYRVGPGVYWSGLSSAEYGDAVIFQDAPPVQVFGYGARGGAASAPFAPAPAAPAAAAPEAAVGKRDAVGDLIDRGDELFGRGEFDRALEAYREATRRAPQDPLAAIALGHGLFATGSYREAAADLRRGLRLYPDLVQVPMNRRDFYGDARVFDEQLLRLEHWVKTSPDDAAARFLLGYNYFFSQHPGKAAVQFALLGKGDSEAQLFLREIRKLE